MVITTIGCLLDVRMLFGRPDATTITLCSMSSFETGSSSSFPSSLPSSSLLSSSSSSTSSPVTPSSSRTSSSSVSRSGKSLLSLAISSADVGSVSMQVSPRVLARRLFRLRLDSGGADLVFRSRLKVPDGAADGPVFMHCAPPSWLWQ